jgi:hypothetical protein
MASKYNWREAMKRIFIIVEGETEERFLRQVVYPHFILKEIHIEAQQWITNRKLGTKGGARSFDLVENHIKRIISRYKADPNVFISTMIDLYGFPKQGNTIFDTDVECLANGQNKVNLLQQKFSERISYRRFIPYIQLHEYEALLLSKPDMLSNLKAEIAGLAPEEINDTPENAPSKRIIRYIPGYGKQKTTAGATTAEKIGLNFLRESCPHFNDWITKLENISTE